MHISICFLFKIHQNVAELDGNYSTTLVWGDPVQFLGDKFSDLRDLFEEKSVE
jgi:hypothetical protein